MGGSDYLISGPGSMADYALTQAQMAKFSAENSRLQKLAQAKKIDEAKEVDPKKRDQINKAATDFEALFLKQMISAMWQSVPKDGLLSGSREEELYRDMLNDALADNMARTQSIGFKDLVTREMLKREKK